MRIEKGECGLLKSPRYLSPNLQSASASFSPPSIDPADSIVDSLADLPPAALRIAPQIVDTLARLGIVTIRQLASLPRDALPSRFGDELLRRLDQATGRRLEPLVAVESRTPIVVSREWDGPVDAQESLAWVLDELTAEAIAKLERRGEGARRIEVTFRCPYAPSITQTIALSRPSREPKNLKRLMRCMLEGIESPEGFIAIRLRVATTEPIVAARQASLVDGEHESAGDAVERLVDRLRIRFGDGAMDRVMLVESHLAERAVKYVSVDELPPNLQPNLQSNRLASTTNETTPIPIKGIETTRSLSARERSKLDRSRHAPRADRPMLLIHPTPIGVMVSPTDDREGHPVQFTYAGRSHRLQTTLGPERVAGLWWTGHDKTRDYFDVTDEAGERFWIFRVVQTWKWYLHGVF